LIPRHGHAKVSVNGDLFAMAIYELDGQGPDLPASGNYFIAETADVIGKVRLSEQASVLVSRGVARRQ